MKTLIRAFAVLDELFDREEAFQHYRPPGSTILVCNLLGQIVAISKYLVACMEDTNRSNGKILEDIDIDFNLSLSSNNSFLLFDQSKTTENKILEIESLSELRIEFRDQLGKCLCNLELVNAGEAVHNHVEGNSKIVAVHQGTAMLERYLTHYTAQLNAIYDNYRIQLM